MERKICLERTMTKFTQQCHDGKKRVIRPRYDNFLVPASMQLYGKTVLGFINISKSGYEFIPNAGYSKIWNDPKKLSKVEIKRKERDEADYEQD